MTDEWLKALVLPPEVVFLPQEYILRDYESACLHYLPDTCLEYGWVQ